MLSVQLLDGKPCPLGYRASEFGTCEGRKQVGPSVSCPEGFVLGGEQTNPYAILSQEYAKCGAVEYYRGRVRVAVGSLARAAMCLPSAGLLDRTSQSIILFQYSVKSSDLRGTQSRSRSGQCQRAL